jgi:hypothetical protein
MLAWGDIVRSCLQINAKINIVTRLVSLVRADAFFECDQGNIFGGKVCPFDS